MFRKLFIGIMAYIIAMFIAINMFTCSQAQAFELSTDHEIAVGYKDMIAGHSEGQDPDDEVNTRCMNGGFGVDLEYKMPLNFDYNKWIGVSLVPGGMLTYSNFETAFRLGAGQPESKQKRESSVRLTGTLRPTLRVWKVRLFKTYGLGYDYNEPTGSFGLGYIRPDDSRGIGIDFTDNISLDYDEYKFVRYDGTTYRYQTFTMGWTF